VKPVIETTPPPAVTQALKAAASASL